VTRAGRSRSSPSSPGPNGLAAHLAGDLHTSAPVSLLAIGEAGWPLLTYGIPLLLPAARPAARLAGANGTWFIQAIGTQSIAVAATSLPQPVPEALAALAAGC
jgi:hypothetical protein